MFVGLPCLLVVVLQFCCFSFAGLAVVLGVCLLLVVCSLLLDVCSLSFVVCCLLVVGVCRSLSFVVSCVLFLFLFCFVCVWCLFVA